MGKLYFENICKDCNIEVVLNVEGPSHGMQGNKDNLKVADAENLSEREDNTMAMYGIQKRLEGFI
jgi:hypothetical protein